MSESDEGAATVWVLMGMLVVGSATAAATVFGAGLVARERAEIASDAAALAGAGHLVEGHVAVCAAAARLATANGATLIRCDPSDRSLEVEVSVSPPWPAWLGPAERAVASAGPAEPVTTDKIRTARSFRLEIESADSRNLGPPALVAPVTGSRTPRRAPLW